MFTVWQDTRESERERQSESESKRERETEREQKMGIVKKHHYQGSDCCFQLQHLKKKEKEEKTMQ